MTVTTMAKAPRNADRLVLAIGAATGLSILGDSLLYNVLPLEATRLGISLPLVGILLSANRLVRLFSNTPVSALYERLGPRRPFVAATVMALAATALYGVGWGFLVFLLARVLWGVAWSSLRQGGYQAVWAGDAGSRGRLMGMLWGTIRLGSATSVILGGYLRDVYGYRIGVGAIALLTALAIPVALSIRWPQQAVQGHSRQQSFTHGWRVALRHPGRRWVVVAAVVESAVEAIVISTTSLFLAHRLGGAASFAALGIGVGTVTGLLLAVRWLSDLVFGPLFGALSDRLSQPRTALLLATLLAAGLVGATLFTGFLPVLCLSLAFISGAGLAVTLSAAATTLATGSERPHLFVGVYATAVDAGLAVGPLVAYSVGTITGLAPLYLGGSAALVMAVARFWSVERPAGEPWAGQV